MLNIYKKLFSDCNECEIQYCSWKNNHALQDECSGDGDIDLLVSSVQHHSFENLLYQNNFIRVYSSVSEYPFVKHYFAYDESEAKFAHLHVYYKLITGDSPLKNYRFPVEDSMLKCSSVSNGGTREAHPQHQAEIYMLRKYVKSSSVLGLFLLFRERLDYKNELEYIRNKLFILKNNYQVEPLFNFKVEFKKHLSLVDLLKIKFHIRGWHRGVGITEKLFQLNVRILNKLIFKRKKTINGSIISIVGLDGSGKSTAVDMLEKWLAKDFTVKVFHFGRPPITWLTWPIRLSLWFRSIIWKKGPAASLQDTASYSNIGFISRVRYAALAFERSSLMRRAHQFSINGGIAILDRHPSPHVGKMDSPRIIDMSKILGRVESSLYGNMPNADLLFKFNVSVEEAIKRNQKRVKKDKETDNEIRQRFEINNNLVYNARLVCEVDAMQSIDMVHNLLKREIWKFIVSTN